MLHSGRLRVLLEISRCHSIAAAAAELEMTPSAVSHALAKLEREMGVALVERTTRSARLTEAGRRLAEHAQHIADIMGRACDELAAHRDGRAGLLRVGFFASAGLRLLPRALARLARDCQGTELELVLGQPQELMGSLAGGELDALVTFEYPLDPQTPSARVSVHPLFEDPLVVVLPADHPLAGRGKVSLRKLSGEVWIDTFGTGAGSSVLERACERAGFKPRVRGRSDHYEVTLGLVRAGLGVALVPRLGMSHEVGVGVCQPVESQLYRSVGVAVRTTNPNPLTPRLIDELLRSAEEEIEAKGATSLLHPSSLVNGNVSP